MGDLDGAHRDESQTPFEVITFGRSGVDIYPHQIGVGLEDVQTFGKYLGGTTANVAVAAARLGRRSAIITGWGGPAVASSARPARPRWTTGSWSPAASTPPVTFCEICPPDGYRSNSTAADPRISGPPEDRTSKPYAHRADGLSGVRAGAEPTGPAHACSTPGRKPFNVLDHGYRPRFGTVRGRPGQVQRVWPRSPGPWTNGREARSPPGVRPRAGAGAARRGSSWPWQARARGRDRPGRTSRARGTIGSLANGLGAGDASAARSPRIWRWPLEQVLQYANAAGAIVASRLECSTAMPTQAEIETLLAGGDPNASESDARLENASRR